MNNYKASPSLAKAIKLLELSKRELAKEINENVLRNSCLEKDKQLEINLFMGMDSDITVERKNGEYRIELNESGIPRMVIVKSSVYAGKQDYKDALWFLRSVDVRRKILLKAARSVIVFQKEFLSRDEENPKDLSIRRLARMSGFHESTISRITKNKVVSTPRGIFRMRDFIGNRAETEMIKRKIKEIIEKEDFRKPLSDGEISRLLGEEGITIARRTVTKYRKVLNIKEYRKRFSGGI